MAQKASHPHRRGTDSRNPALMAMLPPIVMGMTALGFYAATVDASITWCPWLLYFINALHLIQLLKINFKNSFPVIYFK